MTIYFKMYRPFITIILSFFLFHSLKAQDTAAYYIKYFRPDLKSDVKIVTNRDSAEYNMYISPPPIGHFDQKLRNVKQVYIGTNNPKLTGSAKIGRGGLFINWPIRYEGMQKIQF